MFRNIKAKNFLSWKELAFDIQAGVTLIDGFNADDNTSEGSGKSAILNALSWCLYGKLPKDVNIDDVIQQGEKSCEVTIQLSDNSTIHRVRGPNDLYISEGQDPIRGKDMKDTQRLIETHIGMSFETFCQSVYFAQNYPKKFINATEEEKGKILSEIQDLTDFDKARKKTVDMIKLEVTNAGKYQTEMRILLEKVSNLYSTVETLEKVKDRFDLDKLKAIENLRRVYDEEAKKIQDLQAEVSSYDIPYLLESCEVRKKALEQFSADLDDIKNNLAGVEANAKMKASLEAELKLKVKEKAEIDEKLEKFKGSDSKECLFCGTKLEAMADQHKITHSLMELNSHSRGLRDIIEDMEFRIKDLPTDNASIWKTKEQELKLHIKNLHTQDLEVHKKINNSKVLESRVKSLEQSLTFIEGEIEKHTEKDCTDIIKQIEESKLAIEKHKTKANELNAMLEKQNTLVQRLEVLKSGFKEVKSHVFQNLLKELNRLTNRYLGELFEQDVKIKFDNISEDGEISKITAVATIDGQERGLGLYSGGQFSRIQWAVNLALSDIVALRSNKPIDFRAFDEGMKDLSEQSMERLVRLLEKFNGTTILIEHNSLVKNIVSQTFSVEYKNGISRSKV